MWTIQKYTVIKTIDEGAQDKAPEYQPPCPLLRLFLLPCYDVGSPINNTTAGAVRPEAGKWAVIAIDPAVVQALAK